MNEMRLDEYSKEMMDENSFIEMSYMYLQDEYRRWRLGSEGLVLVEAEDDLDESVDETIGENVEYDDTDELEDSYEDKPDL